MVQLVHHAAVVAPPLGERQQRSAMAIIPLSESLLVR
jgi:hypothetical protein